MIDLYLRFADQAEMLSVLEPLGMTYTDDEGNVQVSQGGHQSAAWEVGEIAGKEGWHLNVRVVDPEFDVSGLEQYSVQPRNPVCVWA